MSRLPEQRVWDSLRRHMPEDFLPQRHEDKYSPGIPDLSFVWRGVQGWIELKAARPQLLMRPEQVRWMLRRSREGVPCILLARYGREDWAGIRMQEEAYGRVSRPMHFEDLGEPTRDPVALLEGLLGLPPTVR